MSEKTYYHRNRDVILNGPKDYYKNVKESYESKQEINTETYLKKRKTKRENIEKIDISICQKRKTKEKKTIRISKKLL